jgi:TolA-binding protein
MQPNITDQIIAYLNGELNSQESARLKEKIAANPSLEEEYQMLKSLHQGVQDEDYLDNLFARRMDRKHIELPEETSDADATISRNNVRILRYLIYVAAAVSVLMLVYFLTGQDNENHTPESLFAKYYNGFDQIVEMRSGEDTTGMFANGMKLYSSGNWEGAIHSLNQARRNVELTAAFYIGMCYLELREYAKAEVQFHRVIDHSGDFRQEAEWYLALTLLADNKTEQSEELLQAMVEQKNHYFGEKAKELLDDMKKITLE